MKFSYNSSWVGALWVFGDLKSPRGAHNPLLAMFTSFEVCVLLFLGVLFFMVGSIGVMFANAEYKADSKAKCPSFPFQWAIKSFPSMLRQLGYNTTATNIVFANEITSIYHCRPGEDAMDAAISIYSVGEAILSGVDGMFELKATAKTVDSKMITVVVKKINV